MGRGAVVKGLKNHLSPPGGIEYYKGWIDMLYNPDWSDITRQACDKFQDEILDWIEECGYLDGLDCYTCDKIAHDILHDMINNRDRPEDREDLILMALADMESVIITIMDWHWPERMMMLHPMVRP